MRENFEMKSSVLVFNTTWQIANIEALNLAMICATQRILMTTFAKRFFGIKIHLYFVFVTLF